MEGLVQPDRLRTRILIWAEEEIRLGHLPPKSASILEAVLYRGELPRGEAANSVGTGDRQARRIVSALVEKGVLKSESAPAAAPRIPSHTRVAMDTGTVPGKDGVAARRSTGRLQHSNNPNDHAPRI